MLWGDELPRIGERRVEALSPLAAAGLTAGARKKGYRHVDPNEDVVAVVERDGATLVVCADGHNGMAASRTAVACVLEALEALPGLAAADEHVLLGVFQQANERVLAAGPAAGQPESRTTLVVAVLSDGRLTWAAMGDSLLALVTDGRVELLGRRRSHFIGYPMTPAEVAERLPRGAVELAGDTWVIAASDGLADFVLDLRGLLAEVAGPRADAAQVVEHLIGAACAGGAGDNVAVAAVRATGARPGVQVVGPRREERTRGCLVGGAVGDALGAAIEFDRIEKIRERFGPDGVTDYVPSYGRPGAITDDTQMTLFTAEGLIRAYVASRLTGAWRTPAVVDHAYARWLRTQGWASPRWDADRLDGWLLGERELHDPRAPGTTCVTALRSPRAGTRERPLNAGKGCGGVMRMAPVGLMGPVFSGDRFALGCDLAALTHGHPTGYLAAGALAEIVHALVWRDARPRDAVGAAIERLLRERGHEETAEALRAALALAESRPEPSPEAVATLGEGWVAEEALAIAVYCALVARDFAHGVLAAVNHSGDSDSTGAIAGNLLGAIHGYGAIPQRWVRELEAREVIEALCRDFNAVYVAEQPPDPEADPAWQERYPGW